MCRGSNSSNFSDDMTVWPTVKYGHIFGYFVMIPGLYSQEQLEPGS